MRELTGEALNFAKLTLNKKLVSELMDLVHIKFGDRKFIDLAGRDIQDIGPFFRSLMGVELDYSRDMVPQIQELIDDLKANYKNHPDALVHDMEEIMARLKFDTRN